LQKQSAVSSQPASGRKLQQAPDLPTQGRERVLNFLWRKIKIVLASVTRLRVRSVKYLPAFLWETFLSQRQAARAPGFSGGRLLIDSGRTFWTLTVWENERAMKAFRGSSAHAKVMPSLVEWCDEAAYAHWTRPEADVPSWPEAYERLLGDARLSHVAHPSSNHDARHFAKPRLKPLLGLDLKPAGSARP
jgi:heme-degrading monooxygenase HmoA